MSILGKGARGTDKDKDKPEVHSAARSFGVGESGDDYSDVQNLYPAYASVNSARSNRFFATCPYEAGQSVTRPGNALAPDTATCGGAWEAPPDVRGDIARTMFYM